MLLKDAKLLRIKNPTATVEKADYLESQSVSRERFADDIKRGIFHRLLDSVLRVAAPLL